MIESALMRDYETKQSGMSRHSCIQTVCIEAYLEVNWN